VSQPTAPPRAPAVVYILGKTAYIPGFHDKDMKITTIQLIEHNKIQCMLIFKVL
jgi:hypothetical protein